MPKSGTIRVRVEPELKAQAESVLAGLGLSPTAAITLFYRQIVRCRGLPFEVHLPNAATQRAMRDAESGAMEIEARSMDELFAKLDEEPGPPVGPAKRSARKVR